MSFCPVPELTPLEVVQAKSVLPEGWKAELGDPELQPALLELVRRTTSRLPEDVIAAVVSGRNAEAEGSRGANTLDTMIENIVLADEHVAPLCQDTGTVIFWVRHPFGISQRRLKAQIRAAVAEATARSWLRPNCVAALSGKNLGNNLDPFGETHPVIHFEEWEQPPSCSRVGAARTWGLSIACPMPPSARAGT
jgi:fumarate hydratase class I